MEQARFDVTKPASLCNPADKNGEGIDDSETHLRGYEIQLSKTEPKQPRFVKRTSVKVEDQFGVLLIDVTKPQGLLLPSAKSLQAPADPPDPQGHEVDNFKCYKTKPRAKLCIDDPAKRCKTDADCGQAGPCARKFPKGLAVTLEDEFTPPKVYAVAKPKRLCVPADKNAEGIKHPANHLMCYAIEPVKKTCAAGSPQNALGPCNREEDCGGQSKDTVFCQKAPRRQKVSGIYVASQLGRELVDAMKELELCVPASKTMPPGAE